MFTSYYNFCNNIFEFFTFRTKPEYFNIINNDPDPDYDAYMVEYMER